MGVMSERESMLRQGTNEFGFPQTYLEDEGEASIPVCSNCTAMVMPNRGQGTICDSCAHEALMECQHDYDMGLLG